MKRSELEMQLLTIIEHAWDNNVRWVEIEKWLENFNGQHDLKDEEQLYVLYALSRFMYFSKRLLMQMLKSLYEDHFKAQLTQRIRRNYNNTKDAQQLQLLFKTELSSTKFVGVGNPAESGAHLLYNFRQINRLQKDLFTDIHIAFPLKKGVNGAPDTYEHKNAGVTRYVFFDDLTCSGQQISGYLKNLLINIRKDNPKIEFHYLCLFATSQGLKVLSQQDLFGKNVSCIFELDSTYKAFDQNARYFNNPPSWFSQQKLHDICNHYGLSLRDTMPLGYRDSQLMIGFNHNTPDNTLPIFWDEGISIPWHPVFIRYDKQYN